MSRPLPEAVAVNAEDAGVLLGISERMVRDLTMEGVLPSIDLGPHRNRVYSVEALRAWALERSGREVRDAAAKEWVGEHLSTRVRRSVGRGRPRSGGTGDQTAVVSLRGFSSRGRGQGG